MLADGGIAVAVSLLLYQAVAHSDAPVSAFLDVFWVRAFFYGVAWVALLYVHGAYRLRAHWTVLGEVGAVARSTVWLAMLGIAALFLSASDIQGSGWALLLFPLQGIIAIAFRVAIRFMFTYLRRHGYNVRFLVILGSGPRAVAFAHLILEQSDLGIKVIGYLGDELPAGAPAAVRLGALADLPRVLRERVVDEVAVCVGQEEWHLVEEVAQLAYEEGKIVRVPLHVPELRSSERFLEDLDGTAVLSYTSGPDELASHALKRVFDLVAATVALIVVAPFMLAIAIWLRVRQGPGVIFRQERVGMHGRVFRLCKFRTMAPDAEELYPALAAMGLMSPGGFQATQRSARDPTGSVPAPLQPR